MGSMGYRIAGGTEEILKDHAGRTGARTAAGGEESVSDYETVLFDLADGVATITLNRPEVLTPSTRCSMSSPTSGSAAGSTRTCG